MRLREIQRLAISRHDEGLEFTDEATSLKNHQSLYVILVHPNDV